MKKFSNFFFWKKFFGGIFSTGSLTLRILRAGGSFSRSGVCCGIYGRPSPACGTLRHPLGHSRRRTLHRQWRRKSAPDTSALIPPDSCAGTDPWATQSREILFPDSWRTWLPSRSSPDKFPWALPQTNEGKEDMVQLLFLHFFTGQILDLSTTFLLTKRSPCSLIIVRIPWKRPLYFCLGEFRSSTNLICRNEILVFNCGILNCGIFNCGIFNCGIFNCGIFNCGILNKQSIIDILMTSLLNLLLTLMLSMGVTANTASQPPARPPQTTRAVGESIPPFLSAAIFLNFSKDANRTATWKQVKIEVSMKWRGPRKHNESVSKRFRGKN